MHDLIYAVAFVAMIASPAMVAALGGRKEYNPGPDAPSLPPVTSVKLSPAPPVVRQRATPPPINRRAIRKVVAEHHLVPHDGPTLPMHNARGMANR